MSKADSTTDTTPRIQLRIPGPWRSPDELAEALRRTGAAYELNETTFVEMAGAGSFDWGVTPPDGEIAGIFEDTGRLSRDEITALRRHQCKIHLEGPGGSAEAARAMMKAATALVKAGAAGVMVDSSTAAHGPRDWMKLAADGQPGGLYWAYVAAAGSREAVYSVGMHCLGLRDAEILDVPDVEFAGFVLHNFLGYTYQSGNVVLDGDPLGGEDGPMFRARHYPCSRVPVGSPMYNPYGVWRLEPMGDEDGG